MDKCKHRFEYYSELGICETCGDSELDAAKERIAELEAKLEKQRHWLDRQDEEINKLTDYRQELEAKVERLTQALISSATGLLWYKDTHPESWCDADEERQLAIAEVLQEGE